MIDARCGWDITDYGNGDLHKMGLFLFTLCNGLQSDLAKDGRICCAEKPLILREDQLSPMHTNVLKAQDIINRSDATLVVELFGSDDTVGFMRERPNDGISEENTVSIERFQRINPYPELILSQILVSLFKPETNFGYQR